jgi:hypothetical protein
VLTLALGVGADHGAVRVVDRVLLRPLPYREPGRLVRIWDRSVANAALRPALDAGAHVAAVAGFGAPSDASVTSGQPGAAPDPVRVPTALATGNLFETLGVGAARGGRSRRPTRAPTPSRWW